MADTDQYEATQDFPGDLDVSPADAAIALPDVDSSDHRYFGVTNRRDELRCGLQRRNVSGLSAGMLPLHRFLFLAGRPLLLRRLFRCSGVRSRPSRCW